MLAIYLALIDDENEQNKFSEIYENYKKQMWYTANEILKDASLSEDAVHDAFIGIAKNMKKIAAFKPSEIRAYVLTSARHSALSYLRKNKFGEMTDIDSAFNIKDNITSDIINEAENINYIISAIEKLPESYADVLYMYFVLEMSEKEISIQFDKSITAIRQQIYRGRKKLVEELNIGGEFNDRKKTERYTQASS